MKNYVYLLFITAILIPGCTSTKKSFEELAPEVLLSNSDSLLKASPNNATLINSIIDARLNMAQKNGDLSHYHEVLRLAPNNPTARYYIFMDEGRKHHEKEYKNGQWEAIQSFSKASAIIDTLGEPHFWIGKAYEKKDEMDFELSLEVYDKALDLYLPQNIHTLVIANRKTLLTRKKTYEDFWK